MLQSRMYLVLKFLSIDRAAASSSAGRVAGLKHEIRDYAMEDDFVVVAPLGEGRKVLTSLSQL